MSRSKSTAAKSEGANRQNRKALVTAGTNTIKAAFFFAAVCALSAQPSSISGRVKNLLTGSPVRKAQVVLNPGSRLTITDAEGHYTMAGIAPGRYKLSVERPGFLPVVYGAHGPNRPGKTLLLAAGEVRTEIDFTLEPPAVITGHIYDQDGEPLTIGVQVWKETYRNGHREFDQAASANADDEGEYRVYGLPAGHYYVASTQAPTGPGPAHLREVYPQTFYPGSEEISAAAALTLAAGGEARNIDFHLRKTPAVTVVIQIEGKSDPGQIVSISLEGRDRKTVLRANSNASELRIARVTPGSYTVNAMSRVADADFYARMNVDVGTLDVQGISVTLVPALNISGILRSPSDPSAMAVALSDSFVARQNVIARPEANGKFTWTNLQPGTWMLSVGPMPAGLYLKSPHEIEITAEPRKPVEIVLSSDGASVDGKVANPDAVEGATVLLMHEPSIAGTAPQSAITGFDGTFAFRAIAPGKYRLLAVEDMESDSWNDPQVLKQFDGAGIPLELAARQSAVQNLTLVR